MGQNGLYEFEVFSFPYVDLGAGERGGEQNRDSTERERERERERDTDDYGYG